MYRYEVTVVDDGRSHTVAYSGEGDVAPEPLRQLVAKISGS